MMRFLNWLSRIFSAEKPAARTDLNRSGVHLAQSVQKKSPARSVPKQSVPERQPEFVELDPHLRGQIREDGPGKNVLIRNRYVREDTGTHDTLKILDDSLLDTDEEAGIDPYNTGRFDRSKNWDKRFRN